MILRILILIVVRIMAAIRVEMVLLGKLIKL
jgi:hypothetical protein